MSGCCGNWLAVFRACRRLWHWRMMFATNWILSCRIGFILRQPTMRQFAGTSTWPSETLGAQPAIGAVSLGLLRILADFGVRPDLTGGHSFGELTALCAAGRIDDRSLAVLAEQRGAIMASCAEEGDKGAMLAVFAPLEQVSALLREHGLDVIIANKNAPRQCVLSGPAGEIERVQRLLAERSDEPLCLGIRCVSQPGDGLRRKASS